MDASHNKLYSKQHRKSLRKKATPAEAFLWNYLKRSQLEGRKFRRQHSIDNYIVDFFCFEECLAVELDSEIHNRQIKEDKIRDAYLLSKGIKVVRFENRFVFEHLE
jgi:very-short-patch-repair endonuclease